MMAGEVCTVDFHIDLPALFASSFSFSPAIADGTLEHYSVCDWIDNAVVLRNDDTRRTASTATFTFPAGSRSIPKSAREPPVCDRVHRRAGHPRRS